MAVHNLGYRGWAGELAPTAGRFIVITINGVRRAWTSKWLRRMLFMAWAPMVLVAGLVFALEQLLTQMPVGQLNGGVMQPMSPEGEFAGDTVQPPPFEEEMGGGMNEAHWLVSQIRQTPFAFLVAGVRMEDLSTHESIRHTGWRKLLQFFLRYPQGFLMVMLLGIIAPPLISQDVRSRAFLLYFSRPINRWEYILGKGATIWVFLTLISTLPAFCLYVLGVLLSPSIDVLLATWDVPIRILVASGFLMIPTASLALCLSSMTQESRLAGFAWFAIWILGGIAFFFIHFFQQADEMNRQFREAEMQHVQVQQGQQMNYDGTFTPPVAMPPEEADPPPISNWTYISLYDTLGVAQNWVFGFEEFSRAKTAIIVLTVLTALSLTVLYRRVSAPMRA